MLILLYGPDDYRRLAKKKQIIAEFQKKRSDLGMDFFNLEEDGELERFLGFLKNQSIFEPAKLAVLENAFEIETRQLAAALKPVLAEKGTQVLLAESSKPVKALAFLLEKPSLAQKFEVLEGAAWNTFIIEEAAARSITLAPDAAQFLGTVYAGNTWGLITELQKISSMGSGAGVTIEKKDLDTLDLEIAPNYWALLNGLRSYDARTRLSTLEKLFSLNDPAAKVFNILASQWQEKTPHMAEYDLAVKSGKIDYEEVLLDLAIS